MQTLKRVALVAALTITFAATASADGPCDYVPGQTNTPPCASAQQTSDDSPTLSDPNVPSNDAVDQSITELALGLLQTALTLF